MSWDFLTVLNAWTGGVAAENITKWCYVARGEVLKLKSWQHIPYTGHYDAVMTREHYELHQVDIHSKVGAMFCILVILCLQKPLVCFSTHLLLQTPFKITTGWMRCYMNVGPHLVWLWHWRNLLHGPPPHPRSPQTHTGPQSAERKRRERANQASRKRKWSFFSFFF